MIRGRNAESEGRNVLDPSFVCHPVKPLGKRPCSVIRRVNCQESTGRRPLIDSSHAGRSGAKIRRRTVPRSASAPKGVHHVPSRAAASAIRSARNRIQPSQSPRVQIWRRPPQCVPGHRLGHRGRRVGAQSAGDEGGVGPGYPGRVPRAGRGLLLQAVGRAK